MAELSSTTLATLQLSLARLEDELAKLKKVLAEAGVAVEPGVVGVYEGDFMVTSEGQRYEVPANYASKTMLVSGDTLRMTEGVDGGQAKFKQIGKVERLKASGLLAKKDGKFEVLTEQGSFKVLQAAVKHYAAEPGMTVYIHYPKQHVKGSWAAIEKVGVAAESGLSGGLAAEEAVSMTRPTVPGAVVMPSLVGQREKVVTTDNSLSGTIEPMGQTVTAAQVANNAQEMPVEQAQAVVSASQQAEPAKKAAAATSEAERSAPKTGGSTASSGSAKKSRSRNKGKAKDGVGETRAIEQRQPAKSNAGATGNRSSAKTAPASTKPSGASAKSGQSLPVDSGQIVPTEVVFDDDDLM